jgi:succinate dehydrogenase / fumarate reductase membrane anchor subunit
MPDTPHVDTLRSPLGRARGLGAGHAGTAARWTMTVTSVALVPLTLWFICSMIRLVGASREDVSVWLTHPLPLVLMLVLLAMTFYHLAIGLQAVVDDYIHQPLVRMSVLLSIKAAALLLCLICVVSVLRLGL